METGEMSLTADRFLLICAGRPGGGGDGALAFSTVNQFSMALLYECGGRLKAKNCGFRPGWAGGAMFAGGLAMFVAVKNRNFGMRVQVGVAGGVICAWPCILPA